MTLPRNTTVPAANHQPVHHHPSYLHPELADLAAARDFYRARMGWESVISGSELRLPLTMGMVGIRMSPLLAARVLPCFAEAGAAAPAVTIGSPPVVVLLADANGRWYSQSDMPDGVALLRAPVELPLPPSRVGDVPVRWSGTPDLGTGFLPLAEGVLQVVRTVLGLVEPRPKVRKGRLTSPWPPCAPGSRSPVPQSKG
ncbi:hypothetical protein ACFPM7_22455 [Actinokineospora guangxiensis]|uniref:VOC domain-containing protein n=1 Tax=Actinokineospora guangxiensis TaxID=1490288 RepID=A0ABW0EUA8_9PSEU